MATQTRRQVECFSDRGEMLRVEAERVVARAIDAVTRRCRFLFCLAPSVEATRRTPGREGEPASAEHGYLHCGPSGAGHFVKMVHNGIE
jgi:6-phosphogluconate dehydrogenase